MVSAGDSCRVFICCRFVWTLDCARPCFIFAELLVVFLFFDLVLFVLSHSLCRKGLSGAAGGRSWLGDGWSWPEGRRRGQPRARGRCPRGFGRARPYSWAELAAGTNDTELARGGCRDHAALVELAGAVGQSSQPAWTARGSQFAWLVAVRPWRSSKTMRTAPRSRALRRGAHLTELVGACLPTLLC